MGVPARFRRNRAAALLLMREAPRGESEGRSLMRKVIVNEWMSFDGVVQSAGADDDTSNGFAHGGWHIPYFDQTSQQWVTDGYAKAGGFLFGRRTYELLAGYWPHAKPEEAPVAEQLNRLPKYVASTTLEPPPPWDNARLLPPDVTDAVTALKKEGGGDLHVIGSTQLAQALLQDDLVDGLRLMIDPLVLGGGKRFLPDDGVKRPIELTDSTVTSTGAILATYALTAA
jgi:dihydrofolate reductase